MFTGGSNAETLGTFNKQASKAQHQATELSRAEMLAREGALEQRAEHSWTSHQVILLDEMNSVEGDALEFEKRNLLSEADAELQRHQRQSQGNLQEHQQDAQRRLSEVLRLCTLQTDLLRPKIHQKFSSCDMNVIH